MNRMEMERIKHEAAQKVFNGTAYEWTYMLDQTGLADIKAMQMRMTAEEAKEFWTNYFTDVLTAMIWSDEQEGD